MNPLLAVIYNPLLDRVLLVFAVVIGLVLALVVYASHTKSATNKIFGLLSMVMMLWLVVTHIVRDPAFLPYDTILHRLGIVAAAAMSGLFYLLAHTFPSEQIKLSPRWFWATTVSIVGMMALNASPYAFTGSTITNGLSAPTAGLGLIPFSVLSTVFSVLAVYLLLHKYRHAVGDLRHQLGLVVAGIGIMLSLIIGTILVPIMLYGSIQFLTFTPLYTLIFLGMTAYAITAYRLFNIKILLTQVLTTVLSLVLFARLFGYTSLSALIIDLIVLGCSIVFGFFLVRSVRKEVAQRQKIQLLADELKRSNEQLSEFMSLATHEIRNPATFIKGYTAGALEGDVGKLSPLIRDGMEKLYVRANDIIHLGNQYLNKSKFELNQISYTFAPLDLKKLVQDLVHEFEPAAKQQGLVLAGNTGDDDCTVEADAGKLKEVIANLIDNSIKYTPKGSVTVSVQRLETGVAVEIKDTGVGVPAEVIPKLFKKFSRADAQKANILGTGLGLYISKVFVDAHHGSIKVESTGTNQGSTFTVMLPFVQSPQSSAPKGDA